MKKIIRKYWGVVLIVVLLSTLFAGSAIPAANAATLSWTAEPTVYGPNVTWQLTPGTDVSFVKVAPNGDLFAVDTVAGNIVYKSTNGGTSWTPSYAVGTAVIVDMAISPSYATDHTVFLAANAAGGAGPGQVYISTNSGLSFSVLGGDVGSGVGNQATSIAVAPNYSNGSGEVMVGTENTTAGSYGDVYIWGKYGTLNWAAQGLNEDVTKVAYSPDYNIDATRLAIGSTVATGTVLHNLVSTDLTWDTHLSAVGAPMVAAIIDATVQDVGTALVGITSSTLAFPSDFNASQVNTLTCFAGTVSAIATDNVWRVVVGTATGAVVMGPPTWLGAVNFPAATLVYAGTYASGTLFYGGAAGPSVYFNAAPMGGAAAVTGTWGTSLGGLTGGAFPTYVAVANDYATSLKVYAGTGGADSALNVSTDGGLYFYQAGLIDTTIATIDDYQAANSTTFYMASSNTTTISLWNTTNSGTTWYRVSTITSALPGLVRLSPSYATDKTVFFSEVGVGGVIINVSHDGGTSWVPRTFPTGLGGGIADIAVKDQYTIYVGNAFPGAGSVDATANGGWTWQPFGPTAVAASAIHTIKLDLTTNTLMVGLANGLVYMSTDGNATWVPLANATAVGSPSIAAPATVAFDTAYPTNKIIYAAVSDIGVDTLWNTGDDVVGNGIWMYTVGTSTTWASTSSVPVDNANPVLRVVNIISAPDGTLYASDATAATTTATGGVVRMINPTATAVIGSPDATDRITATVGGVGAGLAAGDSMTAMALAQGSNILYAVDAIAIPSVKTYGDTLAMGSAAPVLTAPATGSILSTATATFTWNAVPGAWKYDVQYDTRSDWVGATTATSVNFFDLNVTTPATGAGSLVAGLTYYFRIRVSLPVHGPWSQAETFVAQLTQVALNAPAQNPVTTDLNGTTSLTPTLSWVANKAATGYELEVYFDAMMLNKVVDMTGANALGAVNVFTVPKLDFSKTYYWRVRAITPTATTDWSGLASFTTMNAPATTSPPITLTTSAPVTPTYVLPTPTVIMPTPTTTEITKQINPTYIWAIIIIGAVLVLAVIVLIVRTRRSV